MMPQTLSRPDPASNLNQPKLRGWTGLRRALLSGLLVLSAFAPVQGAGAEGPAPAVAVPAFTPPLPRLRPALPAAPTPAVAKPAAVRNTRQVVASPAPRVVVQPKPQVRRLIPGETMAFPVGSQPVSRTPGFQLAVPAGYQVYRAPEGWYFLARVQ